MRGRYTKAEVKELDAYCTGLGIELIPCIQTLAHLKCALKWEEYVPAHDCDDILLIGAERTLTLLRNIFATLDECFTTRKVHIGMDEAHSVGLGKYLEEHGYRDRFTLINEHLHTVCDIAAEYGFETMLWSDMFCRLALGSGQYAFQSEEDLRAIREQAALPEKTAMVYWDYYNPEQDFYEKFIQLHRDMGFEPIMGSGIWIWSKLWHDYGKALSSYRPCIAACRKKQVREIFFTMWEDDGAICHYDSAWTGIAKASDLCYDIDDDAVTAKRFNSILQADFQLNVAAAGLSGDIGTMHESGMTMFYDDPLMAMGWRNLQIIGGGQCEMLQEKYRNIVETLAGHRQENNAGNLDYAWNMANFLLKKITMFNVMLPAGKAGDMDTLRRVRDEMLPEVLAAFDAVMALFREQWLACAKPHGLDTIQRRAFGCRGRLEELGRRLTGLLNGEAESIPEWDEPLPDVEQRMILYRDSASSSTWF
jgi:hypothetical protein